MSGSARTDEAIIREYADRPRRYVNAGGLLGLYWGLWMMGGSLLAGASRLAPQPWHEVLVIGMVALPLLLGLGMKAVRQRVIERRTGFVGYRRPWSYKPWHKVLIGLAIAALLGSRYSHGGYATVVAVASHWDQKWAMLLALFLLGLLCTTGGGLKFRRYLRGSRVGAEAGE